MQNTGLGRRPLLAGSAALLAAGTARAQTTPMPSSPVVLNIMDVAGALQIDRPGIERFRTQFPNLLSRYNVQLAPSPELAGKLKAEQAAGRVDIDFVLLGVGPLSDGITQGVWTQLLPNYADVLPDVNKILTPGAKLMQESFGKQFGIEVSYTPSGPLFEYMPDRVSTVPEDRAGSAGLDPRAPRSASSMRARPIPAPAGPSCRACPTSSATRTRPTRSMAGTRAGPTSPPSARASTTTRPAPPPR